MLYLLCVCMCASISPCRVGPLKKESMTSTWWTMSAGHIGPTGPQGYLPILPVCPYSPSIINLT